MVDLVHFRPPPVPFHPRLGLGNGYHTDPPLKIFTPASRPGSFAAAKTCKRPNHIPSDLVRRMGSNKNVRRNLASIESNLLPKLFPHFPILYDSLREETKIKRLGMPDVAMRESALAENDASAYAAPLIPMAALGVPPRRRRNGCNGLCWSQQDAQLPR